MDNGKWWSVGGEEMIEFRSFLRNRRAGRPSKEQ